MNYQSIYLKPNRLNNFYFRIGTKIIKKQHIVSKFYALLTYIMSYNSTVITNFSESA